MMMLLVTPPHLKVMVLLARLRSCMELLHVTCWPGTLYSDQKLQQ
jgi:hypothetical protein